MSSSETRLATCPSLPSHLADARYFHLPHACNRAERFSAKTVFWESEMASSSLMENLSNEFAAAAEQAGRSVVAVQARHRMSSSGIQWRKGVVVTADHAIRREEEIRS